MKHVIWGVLFLMVVCANVSQAADNPGKKLVRGFVNIITAPVEIPKQTRAYWITGAQKTPHISASLFAGAVWGVVQGVKRVGSGVWDIVSFPVNQPQEYASLMQPACVFSEWPRNPKSGR